MRIIFSIFTLLAAPFANADRVGNGGGLWTCMNGQTLNHGQLVDLFEANEEFTLSPQHHQS